MSLSLRCFLRQFVLLATLFLGSCGGGGVGDAPGSVASDVGSGGTGATDVGSGGTGIAGGEGVGSGGTGATASVGVGAIDGFGSIVVNGVRYEIGAANLVLSDVSMLKLGMTVRVTGSLSADLTQGTATLVVSQADLRGGVSGLSAAAGTFSVLGVQVTTDPATVYAGGLGTFSGLANGAVVQVHGLPGTGGQLHATRIERLAAAAQPVLTGAVQNLDRRAGTFSIGSQRVAFGSADFPGNWPSSNLAEGVVVRVRALAAASTLAASSIEPWNPTPLRDGTRLSLGGLVTDYVTPQSLRIDGVPADVTAARITGNGPGALSSGLRVEATGTVRGGVLTVTTLKIRQAPAVVSPPVPSADDNSYSARGSVGAYRSAADFKVQGQDVDASTAVFVGGTAANLEPGRKVLVTGSRVRDDVLVADRVEFLP